MRVTDHAAIEQIERECGLIGKRTADVPQLAWIRVKWRWRFYRIADAGFVLLIWNTLAATAASNPGWKFALAMAAFNSWLIFFAESRARICTRQLHRRAAEQVARDLAGIQG